MPDLPKNAEAKIRVCEKKKITQRTLEIRNAEMPKMPSMNDERLGKNSTNMR
jgi:hypothetical protein